jgi:hypothetical protein
MRNAGTGEVTAKMQARLYLLLLKAELPSPESAARATAKKAAAPAPRKQAEPRKSARRGGAGRGSEGATNPAHVPPPPPPPPGENSTLSPNLHIDMQIHISADASDDQIDTIFKSMAKHLYGRG